MRKLGFVLLCLMLLNCNSEDQNFDTILEGRFYTLTEFNIEIPADGNNDGVFSTNLVEEDMSECFGMNNLGFNEGKTGFIFEYGNLYGINDSNEQILGCYILDYFAEGPDYTVSDDDTKVFINGNEGRIENNIITFIFSTENLTEVGEILNADGTITDYQGSIEMVFTLVN